MLTGDGLLVRLQPTEHIGLEAFEALCQAARRCGNGTIEISSRGSLQVRGLSAGSAPELARSVASLAIPAADGLSIITDPLPDDPEALIDATGLGHTLRRALADVGIGIVGKHGPYLPPEAGQSHAASPALPQGPILPPKGEGGEGSEPGGGNTPALWSVNDPHPTASLRVGGRPPPLCGGGMSCVCGSVALNAIALTPEGGGELAPKVCVVIDGGGRLHLDALAADVRLRAIGSRETPRLHVAVAGNAASALPLCSIKPSDVADIVTHLLRVIASHGADARAADIRRIDGGARFRAALPEDVEPAKPLRPRKAAEVIGVHPLHDGAVALGLALAFGHAQAQELGQLAQAARAQGARAIRLAPGRGLLLFPLPQQNIAALTAGAARLGFIVQADDPRRRIVACAGKPGCAAGWIATRALAAEIAPHLSPRGPIIHISGCAKGCAHPFAAALTVVGTEHGCGIVRDGSPRAAPRGYFGCDELVAEIAASELGTPNA
jgi:sulfite reductase beta subunit-like hemoprotein